MAITIGNENSGLDMSAYSNPTKTRMTSPQAATTNTATKPDGRTSAPVEVINHARDNLAALMDEAGFDNAARIERPVSVKAALEAFNAF